MEYLTGGEQAQVSPRRQAATMVKRKKSPIKAYKRKATLNAL